MSPTSKRVLVALAVLFLVLGGCDRLRLAHLVSFDVSLLASRAVPEIESILGEEMLESLGGRLPDLWPEEVPPILVRAPIDASILIERESLEKIGEDLSRVSNKDFELRLRTIEWELDHRELNHPIDDVEIWVGPEGAMRAGDEGTVFVGHLSDPAEGFGEVVFVPGGRRAFADRLLEDRFAVLIRATMVYDTASRPERPRNGALFGLTIHLDVLR